MKHQQHTAAVIQRASVGGVFQASRLRPYLCFLNTRLIALKKERRSVKKKKWLWVSSRSPGPNDASVHHSLRENCITVFARRWKQLNGSHAGEGGVIYIPWNVHTGTQEGGVNVLILKLVVTRFKAVSQRIRRGAVLLRQDDRHTVPHAQMSAVTIALYPCFLHTDKMYLCPISEVTLDWRRTRGLPSSVVYWNPTSHPHYCVKQVTFSTKIHAVGKLTRHILGVSLQYV